MSLSSLLAVAQLSTPPQLIATASGLMISVRSLGGAVGLAIYSAVFNHGVAANLGSKVVAATLPLGLPPASLGPLIVGLTSGGPAAAEGVSGVTPAIIKAAVLALQEAFVITFRYVWLAAGCFAFVALVGRAFPPSQTWPFMLIWFCGSLFLSTRPEERIYFSHRCTYRSEERY